MPRKARDVERALIAKGFEAQDNRKHKFFIYHDEDGLQTDIRTMLSHQAGGNDVSDSLLGKMANQVRLSNSDFRDLIDCPLSKEDYAAKVRDLG